MENKNLVLDEKESAIARDTAKSDTSLEEAQAIDEAYRKIMSLSETDGAFSITGKHSKQKINAKKDRKKFKNKIKTAKKNRQRNR